MQKTKFPNSTDTADHSLQHLPWNILLYTYILFPLRSFLLGFLWNLILLKAGKCYRVLRLLKLSSSFTWYFLPIQLCLHPGLWMTTHPLRIPEWLRQTLSSSLSIRSAWHVHLHDSKALSKLNIIFSLICCSFFPKHGFTRLYPSL